MSDSVDRVFSHALNTVNKIRTGSQKPPSVTRLRLYGLYKQAMEGDVEGIMERPEGRDESSLRALEKWNAWNQQNGLSRTEAKRRYITTLIKTMHEYASPSPDSRELVAELEFVWDQVKSNVPSSASSSPQQGRGRHQSVSFPPAGGEKQLVFSHFDPANDGNNQMEEEGDMDREEFVDAKDSQQDAMADDNCVPSESHLKRQDPIPVRTPTPAPRFRSLLANPISFPNFSVTPALSGPPHESLADQRWRKRVEQALIKMTAEVAALREQLEARRLFAHSPHYRMFRSAWRLFGAAAKHFAIDLLILVLILLWLRRRGDRRFENTIKRRLIIGIVKITQIYHIVLSKAWRTGGRFQSFEPT